MKKHNLRVFDIKNNDINGGSSRYFICHRNAKFKMNKKKIIKILDESYNSNPLSLKFSLAKYDDAYKDKKNKHILIGDMLELGRFSKKLHIEIAKYINKSKVSKVHVYGKYIKHTYNKLKPQIKGKYLRNSMEILNLIKNELPNKAILMVKGSNSTGLNKIIQSFKNI